MSNEPKQKESSTNRNMLWVVMAAVFGVTSFNGIKVEVSHVNESSVDTKECPKYKPPERPESPELVKDPSIDLNDKQLIIDRLVEHIRKQDDYIEDSWHREHKAFDDYIKCFNSNL